MNKEQQAIVRLAEREEVLHWWLQDGVLPGQLSISDYLTEME